MLTDKNKNLDTYLDLCTEVYDLSKPHPPVDAYEFYKEYARAAKGPILEPMCGTGRFLIPLLEDGFNVHGFDASSAMLSRLHEKAKAKNLQPTVWHGFTQDLNRSEKYDLMFIPSGSFCLITDEEEALNILKAFYNNLAESGVLLFEIETPKAVPELGVWRGSTWPKKDGTEIILSSLAVLKEDVCTSIGKYELISDNKIIRTEIEEYKIKIYNPEKLRVLLQTAGFKKVRAIKAFDIAKQPDINDESMVYECRKL